MHRNTKYIFSPFCICSSNSLWWFYVRRSKIKTLEVLPNWVKLEVLSSSENTMGDGCVGVIRCSRRLVMQMCNVMWHYYYIYFLLYALPTFSFLTIHFSLLLYLVLYKEKIKYICSQKLTQFQCTSWLYILLAEYSNRLMPSCFQYMFICTCTFKCMKIAIVLEGWMCTLHLSISRGFSSWERRTNKNANIWDHLHHFLIHYSFTHTFPSNQ